ncbi:hypothetical protein [Terriglobus tenax]|uniref:hypothetical protein n=1 Tax=Terriglobus tenax TaxID=1111115 RepID=UPI0021E0A393|nr:hypothetical protein [Terriglobus tenax]
MSIWRSGVSFLVLLQSALFLPSRAFGAGGAIQPQRPNVVSTSTDAWAVSHAQHAYGLPDVKPKQKGVLRLDSHGLSFTGKASYSIPHVSILAISNGTERVEMWGMKGRILRMAIPNGGGIAAAGVMHHKESSLTVEFHDSLGGYHAAVFLVPVADAEHVMAAFTPRAEEREGMEALVDAEAPVATVKRDACAGVVPRPGSVLIASPVWEQAEVPASYRALVYEHMIERMQKVKGVTQVLREGEQGAHRGCPQSTVHIAIVSYRPGSQVKRAVMGPAGMFAGTTQMVFHVTMSDQPGAWQVAEDVKATVRGETESKNVADAVAKKVAKSFDTERKKFEKNQAAGGTKLY